MADKHKSANVFLQRLYDHTGSTYKKMGNMRMVNEQQQEYEWFDNENHIRFLKYPIRQILISQKNENQ